MQLNNQLKNSIDDEKKKILNVNELEELEQRMSLNSLRVLASRYLIKNEKGEIIERPRDLFERVAILVTIPDILYDERVFDKNGKHDSVDTRWYGREYDIKIGKFKFNKHHIEAFERLYLKLRREGKICIYQPTLLQMIQDGKFDSYEKNIEKYYNLMASGNFLPNTPTLLNGGNKLGQLSACFAEEQPIITEKGVKPIKEVEVGDLVLTSIGKYEKVTNTMVRKTNKRYILDIAKLPKSTLSVTAEHPILTLIDGEKKWVQVKNLNIGDYVAISYVKEVEDKDILNIIDFVGGEYEVINGMIYKKNMDKRNRSGEISKQVKPVYNEISVDKDFLKILGYYASEGDTDGDVVRFTFSNDEIKFAEEIILISREKFGINSKIEYSKAGNWINVRLHSQILSKFVSTILGNGFNKKKIPSWILKLPIEKQIGFIVGCYRGDSTLYLNKHTHNARLVMSNKNLVYGVWTMLMRMGITPSLRKEDIPKLGTTNPYSCTITSTNSSDIMEVIYSQSISKPSMVSMIRTKEKVINEEVFLPITNKQIIEEQVDVYNFEVKNEHTYVANNISVHNCFVLPIHDNMESIMKAATDSAMIFKSGGGVGINYSELRPEGSMVASTTGVSSGPVSFMEIVDKVADVVKQGGKRRAANMGILKSNHPDIQKFINYKKTPGKLENFNISVGMDKEFWNCLFENRPYNLTNGKEINPKEFIDMIVQSAWVSAEPGMIFLDNMNKNNHLKDQLGEIVCTNPCGEIGLYPYESCNLGSINLANFVENREFKYMRFLQTVYLATSFLDNVIDVNKYPIPELEFIQKTRRIGLGIMGLADALYKMKIPYNSQEGYSFMNDVTSLLVKSAETESIIKARTRGSYPLNKGEPKRNAFTTSIAPTGSISMIAETSNGIEPAFALVFEKRVSVGSFFYTNKYFEQALKEKGIYSEEILKKVADNYGSCKGISEIPQDLQEVFVTAMDIHHYDHLVAQAICQKNIDNAISKTINLPGNASIQDVKISYLLAHELGLKGITVYRDGSRNEQVLHITGDNKHKISFEVLPSEYSIKYIAENVKNLNITEFVAERISDSIHNVVNKRKCLECGSDVISQGGCITCHNCSWSVCSD